MSVCIDAERVRIDVGTGLDGLELQAIFDELDHLHSQFEAMTDPSDPPV